MRTTRRIFTSIGVLGLLITIGMNLLALVLLRKPAAEFLSHGWWASWFPSYMVWTIFLFISLGFIVGDHRHGGPADRDA